MGGLGDVKSFDQIVVSRCKILAETELPVPSYMLSAIFVGLLNMPSVENMEGSRAYS